MPSKEEGIIIESNESNFDELLPHFKQLNIQWIEQYFKIEEGDIVVLDKANENIIAKGGQIFYLKAPNGDIAGCCGVVPYPTTDGTNCFEIIKMAVSPVHQGKGYANVLMETAINWCKARGVKELIILTNSILKPAVTLYEKHGFVRTPAEVHPDFQRCNCVLTRSL